MAPEARKLATLAKTSDMVCSRDVCCGELSL